MSDAIQPVPESRSIFLTGAASGLGRVVMRHLVAAGHRVAGVASDLAGANAIRGAGGLPVFCDPFRAAEVASTLRMAQAQVIVHLEPQAVNYLPVMGVDWSQAAHSLEAGTAALIEAAAMSESTQFMIHTSYTFLYGDAGGETVTEDAHLGDEDSFFTVAAAAEKAALAVPGCVLRAGHIYGPHSAHSSALAAAMRRGSSLAQGAPDRIANWVHEEDLAAAIALAATSQPAGAVFNIADDQPASTVDFVRQFAGALGVQPPGSTNMPALLATWMIHPTQRALMNASARAGSARARAALGWKPQYADRARGLEQMLLAWRAATVMA